jgi:serine/threonine protein kinase
MIPYDRGSYGVIIDKSLSNYIKPKQVYYECADSHHRTNYGVSEGNCTCNKDNIISKLFINKYNDFYNENKNYEIISQIDPQNKFTYKVIKVSEYKVLLDELHNIKNIINKNKYYNYEYLNIYEITMIKADISLLDYLKNSNNTIMFKNNFKKQFLKLLDGIKKLHDYDFVHLDLKETNILVSNDNLYLIDFGFSDYTYNIFYSKYIDIFGSTYIYFPFETKIIYNVYKTFNNYELTTIKEILEYMNEADFIDLYFYNYYNIIEEYNNQEKDIFISTIKDFINELIYKNNILNNNKLDFKLCMKYIFEKMITKIDIYSIGIILYNLSKYLPESTKQILPKLIDISPYNRPIIDDLILMMKNK